MQTVFDVSGRAHDVVGSPWWLFVAYFQLAFSMIAYGAMSLRCSDALLRHRRAVGALLVVCAVVFLVATMSDYFWWTYPGRLSLGPAVALVAAFSLNYHRRGQMVSRVVGSLAFVTGIALIVMFVLGDVFFA